jgi:hypothetical protein
MTEMNDPVVAKAIQQLGIKPLKNGEPAVPQGSRQKVIEPTPAPAPLPKAKKLQVTLDVSQEARLIREAAVKGITAKEHLQAIVDAALKSEIGKPLISGTSWMGAKVTGPSNRKVD